MSVKGNGGLLARAVLMQQFKKKYFDTYREAENWLYATEEANDGRIEKEGDKYYIFVASSSQK